MEINLTKLTDQLTQIRKEDDFNESDLRQFQEESSQLAKELDKPPNVSIQQDYVSLIMCLEIYLLCLDSFGKTYDGVWVKAGDGKVPLDAAVGGLDDTP